MRVRIVAGTILLASVALPVTAQLQSADQSWYCSTVNFNVRPGLAPRVVSWCYRREECEYLYHRDRLRLRYNMRSQCTAQPEAWCHSATQRDSLARDVLVRHAFCSTSRQTCQASAMNDRQSTRRHTCRLERRAPPSTAPPRTEAEIIAEIEADIETSTAARPLPMAHPFDEDKWRRDH
jgi:hypothetical protein